MTTCIADAVDAEEAAIDPMISSDTLGSALQGTMVPSGSPRLNSAKLIFESLFLLPARHFWAFFVLYCFFLFAIYAVPCTNADLALQNIKHA